MQQRRLRLGDILDDYCPRERRVTNHAIVAIVDEEVKQTRCTTCDTEHEYKHARVPPPRRKRLPEGAPGEPEGTLRPRPADDVDEMTDSSLTSDDAPFEPAPEIPLEAQPEPAEASGDPEPGAPSDDDGPVHRRLIRATLPRPEGQAPERKEPEFTIRQPGNRGGRGRPGRRPQGGGGGGQQRFGQGSRPGGGHGQRHGSGQGQGQGPGQGHGRQQGNRNGGAPGGHRGGGGRPGQGPGQGLGRGGGRKRGR